MNKIKSIIGKFRFSLGIKINSVLAMMILLFIIFSLYSQLLLKQFNNTYKNQVRMYYSILELKDTFSGCNTTMNEYLKSGNKTTLADFNHKADEVRVQLKRMNSFMENDESLYLLRSIENAFSTYYSECCSASFLYNSGNYDYYGRMYYAQKVNDYLLKYCDTFLQLTLGNSVAINEKLTGQQKLLIYVNGGVVFLVIIMFFVCATYIHLNVTKPLNELVDQARQLSMGNLNVKVTESKFPNTVGVLSKTFNDMAHNIKTMMESIQENVKTEKKLLEEQRKNIEYSKLLNQATFMALQTQTNPHFLFNTLNSISRTITLGKEEQALLMIDSLATLLRYSLTDAEVPVRLSQELSITNEYLKIQKFRFSDRIQAAIYCEEGLDKDIVIPRFTLQPLVENAIIHGLEPKEEGGMILITVKRRGEYCIIKIADNGVGIPKERLNKIKDNPVETTSKCIGIWNTQKRIRIFTGQQEAFEIYSKENRGTVVTIKLLIMR